MSKKLLAHALCAYIGTKSVLATTMTCGEYNEYRGWQMQKYYEDSLAWKNNPLFGWCAKNKKKELLIEKLFLPLGLKSRCFWGVHFPVLGIDEVMKIGEMVIF